MNSHRTITNKIKNKFDNSTNSLINKTNMTYIYELKKSTLDKNNKYIKYINFQNLKNNNIYKPVFYINNKSNLEINKYKTANNSPNKLLGKENPKSLRLFNTKIKISKNLLSKNNSKLNKLKQKILNNINNKTQNNSKNKIIKKKSKEKVITEEIFKKKLAKKIKKTVTSKNSINNRINLNSANSKNMQITSSDIIKSNLKINNNMKNNKKKIIKSILIEDNSKEKIINKDFLNYTNINSNKIKWNNINSCRDTLKKIDFKKDYHINEKISNTYGNTTKNFYMIKKYNSLALSNQPKRPQNFKFSKTKNYNTISTKKILNRLENNKKCLSSKKLNIIKKEVKEVKDIKSKIQKKYINRAEYTIYVKQNLHIKNLAKTSNKTTHNSRKISIDKIMNNPNKKLKIKTPQIKQGKLIGLSSENDTNNNKKITTKSISTNNYSNQNSELINKSHIINKNGIDYNFLYNIFNLNNNKNHVKNEDQNKRFKKVYYSTKSSKEKTNHNLKLQKKNYLDILIKSIKTNNLNLENHNYSKEEIKFKQDLSYKLKTPIQKISSKKLNLKIRINEKRIEKKYTSQNTPKQKNNNSKININRRLNKYIGGNPKKEIYKKNSFDKSNELIEPNKIKAKKMENINEEKFKENKEKEEKVKKKNFDKDLSDKEEDKSLLKYLNNNIDESTNTTIFLNESIDSIHNVSKDNNKCLIYSKGKEIISNYIKQYYKKHKIYPKTKMKFYKYGRLLGKGAFGKVNLCLHTLTGRLVAIKSINKSKITKERQRQKIRIETAIMKALSDSNNIVKIFETYETKKHICIVMEYICAGDLLSYIKKRSKLTENIAKFIFKQIILALKYIHSHNIIHRDIKLDNILIDLDNNIKICDFGVSKKIKKGDIMVEQCGTPAYIAPEILKNRGYEGFGVDIWSAGVVLYTMLSGTVPFKGGDLKELHKLIIEGQFKEIKNISNEANHLLKCLLEVEPKNRIKIQDILVHPWMIDSNLNFFKTQNLFTNAEYILLAKSNVDYSDINNKDNMDENFDIKNLDTEEENFNLNIKTKSIILAPFNSSISIDEDESNSYEEKENDFKNPDLIIKNGIIKFAPKVRDLNRNYELNNNQEIDNGIIILSYDSDEKVKKDKSPNDISYNSKAQSKPFSPVVEKENNNIINNKNNDIFNEKILEKIKNLGYSKEYVKKCINNKEFNYATTTYKLLSKFFFE